MDLQAAILARLWPSGALSAAVNRAAWGGVPEKTTLDYLVLSKVDAGQQWTHSGPDQLVYPWVQFDIYGATRPRAAAIAAALQAEMQRLDRVTVGGWHFDPPAELINDQWTGPETLVGGGEAYRIMHEYRFYAQPEE